MIYILDTNICIYMLKNRSLNILKHAKNSSNTTIFISTVTVAELWHGVIASQRVQENEVRLNSFLSCFDKLPFEASHAKTFGFIKAEQQKKGKTIGAYDLQIAAQAIDMDAVLVTANEKEFKQIRDLRVINWIK